ncbi:polysaccharide deacetylase family protein [Bradyrhizobium guangxiense]
MVSFTFDDAPDSAAGEGAALLEQHGGRGTFYLAGSLIGQPSDHWHGLSDDAIVGLHRAGHEIACHTFSHQRLGQSRRGCDGARDRAEPVLFPCDRFLDHAGEFRLSLWHRLGLAQAAACQGLSFGARHSSRRQQRCHRSPVPARIPLGRSRDRQSGRRSLFRRGRRERRMADLLRP